jgi:hypothetical protein
MKSTEIIQLIKDAISDNGDYGTFLDTHYALLEKFETTTDEDKKKTLGELLDVFLMLQQILSDLQYYRRNYLDHDY